MIKNKVAENRIELMYKILYFIFVLISFTSFCARKNYISYISYVVVIIGLFLFINRLTHVKDYLNARIWLLVAFVISYVFSAINTIRYGFVENLQAIAWMGIQFFIIFAWNHDNEKVIVKNEYNIIFVIFIVYTMAMSILALVMMINGYSKNEIVDNYYYIYAGFLFNRLWGAYTDPNYGAVLSLISIIFSCYYFKRSKTLIRILLVVYIITEYLYISYSDSRTGEIAILMAFTVLFFEFSLRKIEFVSGRWNIKNIIKVLLAVVFSIVLACFIWYGTHAVQRVTSDIRVNIAKEEALQEGATEEQVEQVVRFERVGRVEEQIHGGDISNNRFDIWYNGYKIFKQNPILGISFRNIMEYSLNEMPNDYVGFESMHNAFVDVLVSQGLLGMIILVSLMSVILIQIFKKSFKLQNDEFELFAYSFSCIFAIIASMLTYSETFYMNTGGAFIFWYLLGLITNYLLVDNKEMEN